MPESRGLQNLLQLMLVPFAYIQLCLDTMAVLIHVGHLGYTPFSSGADASRWICTDKRVDAEDFIPSRAFQIGFVSDEP